MNIVVTGASGFIGLNLLERLLGAGHRVFALSADGVPARAREAFRTLPGTLDESIGDVRDERSLATRLAAERVDAIVAAAAITAGPERERSDPAGIFAVNVGAVLRAVELAGRHGVRRVIVFSSTAAMGEQAFGGRPMQETDAPTPVSVYGIGKAALEAFAARWATLGAAPEVVALRLSAVFGPWERATGVRDTLSPLLHLASAAVRGQAIAPMPQAGHRDWVDAPYVARAVEATLLAPRLPQRLVNVSVGEVWHPRLFVKALADVGIAVTERADGIPIPFADDVTRARSPLAVERVSALCGPPPRPDVAARAYAEWVASHRYWFAA